MRSEYVKNLDSNVVRCCSGNASMMSNGCREGKRVEWGRPVDALRRVELQQRLGVYQGVRFSRAMSE
jgi:hypothetical protein